MTAKLSDGSRLEDFKNGSIAMDCKDYDKAIENFQMCMKKLSSQGLGLTSDLFPKCLQNISFCYKEKDDIVNAITFAKFEKLYYETVLLHDGLEGLVMKKNEEDASSTEPSRDRGDGSSEASNQDPIDEDGQLNENQTLKRAVEYEQLAKLCLEQECVSLALEYSGKATILYRHHFGDDNPSTKKSFEFFTSVYAEAGKEQYSESMEKAEVEADLPVSSPSDVEETIVRHRRRMTENSETANEASSSREKKPLKRTRSILKKPSTSSMSYLDGEHSPIEPHRRVTFADPLPQMVRLREDGESDNSATNLVLFVLICILIVLISLLLSALVCQMKPDMGACVEFRREMTYYYNYFRYLYRTYLKR